MCTQVFIPIITEAHGISFTFFAKLGLWSGPHRSQRWWRARTFQANMTAYSVPKYHLQWVMRFSKFHREPLQELAGGEMSRIRSPHAVPPQLLSAHPSYTPIIRKSIQGQFCLILAYIAKYKPLSFRTRALINSQYRVAGDYIPKSSFCFT